MDAQSLVGELVAAGSVFAFLAEHRHELFPDSFIADLFSSATCCTWPIGVAIATTQEIRRSGHKLGIV